MRSECPADLRVLFAPFDVRLAADTHVQPHLLVARRADFSEKDLPVYVDVADVSRDESWTASLPFEVTVVPARLLDA